MNDSTGIALRPRLWSVQDVQRACGGIGRDLALQLMHRVGPIYLGRRIFCRPEDVDKTLAELRADGK